MRSEVDKLARKSVDLTTYMCKRAHSLGIPDWRIENGYQVTSHEAVRYFVRAWFGDATLGVIQVFDINIGEEMPRSWRKKIDEDLEDIIHAIEIKRSEQAVREARQAAKSRTTETN